MILRFSADMNKVAAEICQREDGVVQVNIGQTKQILAILAKLIAANPCLGVCLVEYGCRLLDQEYKEDTLHVLDQLKPKMAKTKSKTPVKKKTKK